MATMWPRQLPREVVEHPYRKAEVEVYRQLAKVLGDHYAVFYSRPWLGLTASGEEIDGECDFLVCHADRGMLAIEVKGGGIDFDPATEVWTSTNRDGIRSKIKDPVKQARSSKHRILEQLKDSGLIPPDRYVRARHGVIFPDCEEPNKRMLGPDRPRGLFCNEQRFDRDLAGWIEERLSGPPIMKDEERTDVPLGVDGVKALEQILAAPIHLKIPLRKKLRQDEEDIRVLTRQQYWILKTLAARERAAICGPAGTGKTVLAIEEAVRFAREGKRTGLLCFNQGLAEDLRARTAGEGIHFVGTFHEYCGRAAASAGITVAEKTGRDLYEEVLPEALLDALERKPELAFEAVVIDEGQDFRPLWWTVIEALLTGPKWFRVFFDRNQLVYRGREVPAEIPRVLDLFQVLRNTQQIFRACRHLYENAPNCVVEAIGPEGEPVQYVPVRTPEMAITTVLDTVKRLIDVEHVNPGDIAVLLPRDTECQQVSQRLRWKWCKCTAPAEDAAVVDTVRRFKGLERAVVVVYVDGDVTRSPELTYVAMTRGRSLLIVVAQEEHISVARGVAEAVARQR